MSMYTGKKGWEFISILKHDGDLLVRIGAFSSESRNLAASFTENVTQGVTLPSQSVSQLASHWHHGRRHTRE